MVFKLSTTRSVRPLVTPPLVRLSSSTSLYSPNRLTTVQTFHGRNNSNWGVKVHIKVCASIHNKLIQLRIRRVYPELISINVCKIIKLRESPKVLTTKRVIERHSWRLVTKSASSRRLRLPAKVITSEIKPKTIYVFSC